MKKKLGELTTSCVFVAQHNPFFNEVDRVLKV